MRAAALLLAALLPLAALAQEEPGSAVQEEMAPEGAAAEAVPGAAYGWKEYVRLETLTRYFEVEAKLDTGADSSSLHARHIEVFERGGQNWVRFTVNDEPLEQPIVRRTRIRQKNGEPAQERWVVRLDLCIGQVYMPADFSLVDRTGFTTKALLGRDVLDSLGLIDPSREFSVEPRCSPQ